MKRHHMISGRLAASAVLALLFAAAPRTEAQSFTEPGTVFYGKVLGTGSLQDFLITDGVLTWTLQREDGSVVDLRTTLYAYHDGAFSYRLDVPHSALALDLEAPTNGIPLPPSPATYVHLDVRVDGEPAALLGPAGTTFTVEQLRRTATYRLDIGVGRVAVDTDGDGIPDWWEDLHGLDKQDPLDAGLDANGDDITALSAYQQNLDPDRDARAPLVRTGDVVVYPVGLTALLLDTADLDSPPADLVYTLTALPAAGQLLLRDGYSNPSAPDAALGLGDSFTHADVLQGRVVFDPAGAVGSPGSFAVDVTDGSPTHTPDSAEIRLLTYAPAALIPADVPEPEALRLELHGMAGSGRVVADGSGLASGAAIATPSAGLDGAGLAAYLSAYGPDAGHAMVVPPGANGSASGGHGDDTLYARCSGLLVGGLGADRFIPRGFGSGLVTVGDFDPAEGDVLDLSWITDSPVGYAHQYLRFVTTGGVVRLQTDLDGNGSGFTNLAVALPGLPSAQADLYALAGSGALDLGALELEPRISIAATVAQASENGPTSGRFTFTREGSLDGDLTVQLAVSGSAQNGSDYQTLPTSVFLPGGVASVDLDVLPFADGLSEPAETVVVAVAPGSGYRIGPAAQATVTLEDLLMLVELEVLEPVAVRDDGVAAVIAITRRDVISRDALIRLDIGGTAANGVDYNTLPTTVLMGINQTVALIQVVPKPGAVLAGGMETVRVSVRPDAAYRVDGEASVQVAVIERYDSFPGWLAREFPDLGDAPAALAGQPAGAHGLTFLELYAFGLGSGEPADAGLPAAEIVDGRLELRLRTPVDVTDVTYRVYGSTDLMAGEAAGLPLTRVPGGEPGEVRYRAEVAADEAPIGFGFIELEWTP